QEELAEEFRCAGLRAHAARRAERARDLSRQLKRQLRSQTQREHRLLCARREIELQLEKAFPKQPDVERAILVRWAESVIRRDHDEGIGACKLDQASNDFIDPLEVFKDAIAVSPGLFRVMSRMLFVDDVPQLVLNAIGAPEILEERIPFVSGHQVLGDLSLVLQLVKQLIEHCVDVAFSISLRQVQPVRSKL